MMKILLLTLLLSFVASATVALDAGLLEEYNRLHKNAGTEMQAYLDTMYFEKSTCTYCFEGAPECSKGPCSEAMKPFVDVLAHEGASFFAADYDYLIAVHNTATYRFSNFLITHLGCKAIFTGIATTTFNDDNKIVDHVVLSSDTPQILGCIGEFYEWKQNEAEEGKEGQEL